MAGITEYTNSNIIKQAPLKAGFEILLLDNVRICNILPFAHLIS